MIILNLYLNFFFVHYNLNISNMKRFSDRVIRSLVYADRAETRQRQDEDNVRITLIQENDSLRKRVKKLEEKNARQAKKLRSLQAESITAFKDGEKHGQKYLVLQCKIL